ncbi:hypothetical protein ACQP2U_10380 [Nocardia sp. CA-084685]|uniref:hypothetical protein n=1 Tax=Nocardia sp. CA-084685 TaxID=3239970 RepID=UPI003D9901A4
MSTETAMPGVRPPGMDRPDTNPNYQIEKEAEPMTDTTAAAHQYLVTGLEQVMRSDFMHAELYSSRDPEDYDPADELDYREYASPWLDRNDEWADHWRYLSDATQRWRDDHAYAERMLAMHQRALSPIEVRSEEQARWIAEHGIERDQSGLLTSHYVTRVDNRAVSASDDRFIPMTDPQYYSTAESDDERQLRADYVRYIDELNYADAVTIDPDVATDGSEVAGHRQAADDIATRWENHDERYWRDVWDHLGAVTTAWEGEPETMRRTCRLIADRQAVGDQGSIEPIRWRNYQQAAELTGHGTWDTETDRPSEPARDMPWANAAEIRTSAPFPVSSAFAAARTRELASSVSPLANYRPGNALAASLANAERDGAER